MLKYLFVFIGSLPIPTRSPDQVLEIGLYSSFASKSSMGNLDTHLTGGTVQPPWTHISLSSINIYSLKMPRENISMAKLSVGIPAGRPLEKPHTLKFDLWGSLISSLLR